jgi:cell division protein ZapA
VSELALTINGRSYTVACDDGQESHLERLAGHIDQKVAALAESVGQVGEPRLLVMASLLIADELSDAYARIAELEQRATAAPDDSTGPAAAALESCASRLESLAARIEGA